MTAPPLFFTAEWCRQCKYSIQSHPRSPAKHQNMFTPFCYWILLKYANISGSCEYNPNYIDRKRLSIQTRKLQKALQAPKWFIKTVSLTARSARNDAGIREVSFVPPNPQTRLDGNGLENIQNPPRLDSNPPSLHSTCSLVAV